MADPAAVATALFERCETLSVGSPALPIAYPDVAFTPPGDGRYLQVDLFANVPRWQGLASGRLDQGLLQITVVTPPGEGIVKARELANVVMSHFPKGLRLGAVKISAEPWDASPLIGDGETRTPITIPWVA
jgi:hypothetical protein